VLGVALAVRVAVVFGPLGSMPLVSDAWFYSEGAKLLAARFPGDRVFFWPPGTPFVLALAYSAFGEGLLVARAVAIALATACVGLTMLLAARAVRDPRAAAWAGWIAALYPPAILMSGQPYSQHLASVCLLLFAWALLCAIETGRLAHWAVAGLALGLGAVTRPSMLTLAPLLAIAGAAAAARSHGREPARARRLALGGLVACTLAAACVLPTMLHNARLGGGLAISTNNERNFFLGNNAYTPSYKTSQLADRDAAALGPEAAAYIDAMTRRNDLAARRRMMDEASRYIGQHPLTTFWRTLNRARAFWGFDYIMSRQIQNTLDLGMPAFLPLLAAEAGGYLLVAAATIAALIVMRGEARAGAVALLLLLVIGYALPYTIAFSGGTYHFPVVWLVMPFAAVALSRALHERAALRLMVGDRRVVLAVALFVILQIEFAYHTLALRP
jgi:4-amino-4-deoxy-L-arabinose transferase-like glycosyltransferase